MARTENSVKPGATADEGYGRFDFMGTVKIWATISAVTLAISLVLFLTRGFNYGIDFAGGTEIQVLFKDNVSQDKVREFLKSISMGDISLQKLGDQSEYLMRFDNRKLLKDAEGKATIGGTVKVITDGLKKDFGDAVEIRRVDSVGPQIGNQLKRNSVLALFYGLLAILIYTAMRFDYNYAPGAVLCLFHDSLVALGFLVLLNKEITVQTLAGILTLVGYSMNDTIVVFDRIREDVQLYKEKKLSWVINRAINTTLSRTIITSFLTFMVVLSLYLFGAGAIKDFAFVMCVGIVFGTYSSIYVAAPLIILFDKYRTIK